MEESQPRTPNTISDIRGGFYIVVWLAIFYIRRVLLSRFIPAVFLCLFSIELLLGPSTHLKAFADLLINFFRIPAAYAEYAWMAISFGTALLLFLHHRKLEHRIRRHRALIGQIVVLLGKDPFRGFDGDCRKAVSQILDVFVASVGFDRPGFLYHATVLVRTNEGEHFQLYEQDTGSDFAMEVGLHKESSVAGVASREDAGTLVYVPCSVHEHGIRIVNERTLHWERDEFNTESVKTARPLYNIFQKIDSDRTGLVNSLLCTKVANESLQGGSGEFNSFPWTVLCLSSPEKDAFGDLEFSALKLFSSLVFLTMSRAENHQVATRLP